MSQAQRTANNLKIHLATVNFRSQDLVARLLASVPKDHPALGSVLVVNNSPEDPLDKLEDYPVRVLSPGANLGFGKACNLAIEEVWRTDRHDAIWLVNPDSTLLPGALDQVARVLGTTSEYSILGTLIRDRSNNIDFAGGYVHAGWIGHQHRLPPVRTGPVIETSWVTGGSMVLALEKFREMPGFDPGFFLYGEDVDLCLRSRSQGHRLGMVWGAEVLHNVSEITGRYPRLRAYHSMLGSLRVLRRHYGPLAPLPTAGILGAHALLTFLLNPPKSLGRLQGIMDFYLGRFDQRTPSCDSASA